MNEYKFIYYCPRCRNILFKSNQHLSDGEIKCSKCQELDKEENTQPIQFSDLYIKVIHIDKDKIKGLE